MLLIRAGGWVHPLEDAFAVITQVKDRRLSVFFVLRTNPFSAPPARLPSRSSTASTRSAFGSLPSCGRSFSSRSTLAMTSGGRRTTGFRWLWGPLSEGAQPLTTFTITARTRTSASCFPCGTSSLGRSPRSWSPRIARSDLATRGNGRDPVRQSRSRRQRHGHGDAACGRGEC